MSTYAALFIQLIGLFIVARIVVTAPSSPSQDESGTNISTNVGLPIPQNLTLLSDAACWVPYAQLIANPLMTWWEAGNRQEWADAVACLRLLKLYYSQNCASEARAKSGVYVCGAFLGKNVVVTYMDPVFDVAISNILLTGTPTGKTWESHIGTAWAIGITVDYHQDHGNVNHAIDVWRSGKYLYGGEGTGTNKNDHFVVPVVKDEMYLAAIGNSEFEFL